MNKRQADRVIEKISKQAVDIVFVRVTKKYLDPKTDRSNIARLWHPTIKGNCIVSATGRKIPLNHVLKILILKKCV
ncbi:MAG: hypothetical protein IPJ51_10720 [Saprospiraceae bacterium]|nr:hypothetical protein [Saprospiraceae bacterium]